MAIVHQVAGATLVKFNGVDLGFSRDGVTVRLDPRWHDIFSDDFGGAEGAPADSQILGVTGTVICDLTKYDLASVEALTAFVAGGSVGTLPPLGTLTRQENQFGALLLQGNTSWSFPHAIPREAQEVNKGTKNSTYVIGFACYINSADARVLFTSA